MSSATIREKIKAILDGVDGVGRVHSFERYGRHLIDLKKLYAQDDAVLGFYIRRVGFRRRKTSENTIEVVTRWQIRGFASLVDEDETGIAFDELIDSLVAAFDLDETIGGAVVTTVTDAQAGLQLEDAGPAMFCGHLCHSAELALQTVHYDNVPEAPLDGQINTILGSWAPEIGADHEPDYEVIASDAA